MDRVKIRKLNIEEVDLGRAPEDWDSPGCCEQVKDIVVWLEGKWVLAVDETELAANYCLFCGTALTYDLPPRKKQ